MSNYVTDTVQKILDDGEVYDSENNMRYSEKQIIDMLKECSIDEPLKELYLNEMHKQNAKYQFIINMIKTEDFKTSGAADYINYPDSWQMGYNELVTIFQQYNL
jgi:hypothetical protein